MTIRRKWPSRIIFGICAAYFLGGFVAFPYAPYRPCTGGYCDKMNRLHTQDEYHHQKMWEAGLVGLWATAILALWLLNRAPRKP